MASQAGLDLDPWEEFVLAQSLGFRADGKWAAFEVGVDVPRQNGKGSILEARELAGLFLLDERLIIHSAHEFPTSLEAFRRLLFLIEDTPDFDRQVQRVSRSHGEEGIELKNRQRIRFRTRTKGGGRGFTGDCLILDEAMYIPEAMHGALLPTLSARPNPQVWYTGSAVDRQDNDDGVVFARVRDRGHEGGDPALAYFEWSVDKDHPGDVDPETAVDPEAWARANPGLGIRITAEHIAREQRSMDPRTFAVERLGVGDWPPTTSEADRIISRETWEACAETDPAKRIADTPTFAIDLNPERTRGAIGVAGTRDDGLPQVAVVDHRPGTDWIVDRCVDLQKERPGARIVLDKRGPAAALIEKLKTAGVELVEVSAEDYGRACGGFFDEVEQNRLRYPDPQPELSAALAGAKIAPLGDAWKWSRRSSAVDITTLVACTLALWGATNKPAPEPMVAWI